MSSTPTPPSLLRRLSGALLDALAPHICPLCGAPIALEEGVCEPCLDLLPPAPFPNELTSKLALSATSIRSIEHIAARWNFTLDSPVQELVHALKYEGLRTLARQMGASLGLMLAQFPEFARATVVVPVPLHRSRMRERGYNQAAEIAHGIVKTLPKAEVRPLLRRARATRTQTKLDASERGRNVERAFILAEQPPPNAPILLCDDVCTTGATLEACARVLRSGGAPQVLAATLAYDDPTS